GGRAGRRREAAVPRSARQRLLGGGKGVSGDCNHRGSLLQVARDDVVKRGGWSVMIIKIKAAVLHWTECRDAGLFHRLGIRADMFRQIQTPSSNLLQNLRD